MTYPPFPTEPMSSEDRAFVCELLIEAGFTQPQSDWMSASCPSVQHARWLIADTAAARSR